MRSVTPGLTRQARPPRPPKLPAAHPLPRLNVFPSSPFLPTEEPTPLRHPAHQCSLPARLPTAQGELAPHAKAIATFRDQGRSPALGCGLA